MKSHLEHIALIKTGVYAKTTIKGDSVYLQPKDLLEESGLEFLNRKDLFISSISPQHILQKDDILFTAKGNNNMAYIFKFSHSIAAASTSFFVIKVSDPKVLPEYIVWYLNQPKTQQHLKKFARGTAMVSISKEVLKSLEVPIPSIDRQHTIIEIDKLLQKEKRLKVKLEFLKETLLQQQLLNALK
ncbi:MAG: restriction endonuclease subunit S [Flavobacteriales bacterium]|nr:restriction endonuclease subunit S [Flavobacteriales bacterium]